MDIKTMGIDLAKKVFQLHGVDRHGQAVLVRRVGRKDLLRVITQIKPCVIAMEACGSCHYWAREFMRLGHEVKLIAAQHVRAFVRTNKNDANDAAAIVEAVVRPNIRFVPIKEVQHQDIQALHRTRERLIGQKVRLINQIRGFLLEYGVLTPDSRSRMVSGLSALIETHSEKLTPMILTILKDAQMELLEILVRIKKVESMIQGIFDQNPMCQLLTTIPGVGLLTSTAIVGSIVDANQFHNGRDFSAYLGLVPKQHSTGGIPRLLGISKRGNKYLRKLIVHGARSKTLHAPDAWYVEIKKRRGMNKAVVAQANKTARILWAVMKTRQPYQA